MRDYLSLIRFSHTIFAMPFALLGFVLGLVRIAEQKERPITDMLDGPLLWQVLLPVVGCMIFARSAAMAFNRYTDRHFDALNERTAQREIPAGKIHARHAFLFTVISSLLFVATTWLLNPLCFGLSFVALFIILIYSYTKQFTALCHIVLGLGLSIAPIGAYLAVTASFHWLPIIYAGVVLAWVSGFDIVYALQDEEFDKGHQLHSIPARLGKPTAIRIAQVLHLLAAVLVVVIGRLDNRGWLFWTGAVVFISMLVWQHRLVKPNDLRKINLAFMTTNGIASVVFCILVILDLLNIF